MAKLSIVVVLGSFAAGCSTGPNQPSSNLMPVSTIVSAPGTAVDKAQWDVLERIAVGQEFNVEGMTYRKLDDYFSARKSRCFRVLAVHTTQAAREYQVVCRDQEDVSSWYVANQVLASETGGSSNE